jgi:hypothetical protein
MIRHLVVEKISLTPDFYEPDNQKTDVTFRHFGGLSQPL